MLLAELGLLNEARQALEQDIDLEPAKVRAYYNLTLCRKMALGEPRVRAMEALAADPGGYGVEDRMTSLWPGQGLDADVGDAAPRLGNSPWARR